MNDKQKNKNNKFYLGWDFKSIIASIVVFAIVGLIIYSFYKPTSDNLDRDNEYYNSETKGVVYAIERKTYYSQGFTGNKESTLKYEIRYYYNVNGYQYNGADFIRGNTIDEANFISFANKYINHDTFIVRYVSWKPEESFVVKSIDK